MEIWTGRVSPHQDKTHAMKMLIDGQTLLACFQKALSALQDPEVAGSKMSHPSDSERKEGDRVQHA